MRRLQNIFSDRVCRGVERIEGDGLWLCLSFIIMDVREQTVSYMERNR